MNIFNSETEEDDDGSTLGLITTFLLLVVIIMGIGYAVYIVCSLKKASTSHG